MSSVKTAQVLKMLLSSGREVEIHSGSPTHTAGSHAVENPRWSPLHCGAARPPWPCKSVTSTCICCSSELDADGQPCVEDKSNANEIKILKVDEYVPMTQRDSDDSA